MNQINQITDPKVLTETLDYKIAQFENSQLRKNMDDGENYYSGENTEIMNRKMLIYAETDEGVPYETEDPYKSNNKMASGFLKLLIDQKVNYLLSNDLSLKAGNQEAFEDIVGMDFKEKLKSIGKEASKKAVAWMHIYIGENGDFKKIKIPSEQVIPVYSNFDEDKLDVIIRYYNTTGIDKNGELKTKRRVEVWDSEEVTYYERFKDEDFYSILTKNDMQRIFGKSYTNPKPHFQKEITFGKRVFKSKPLSWGEIPFIPLYNNEELQSDLKPIKTYIDAFDKVKSDFVNNLEDFQDIYWILKGYPGENVSEFLNQVKRYKVLKVGMDEPGIQADAKAETIEIPYEARKEALAGIKNDIYNFGQGFNPDNVGDGNITNVVIKSRFTHLDLKANDFESNLKKFFYKMSYFVDKYADIQGMEKPEIKDVVFNRANIINESELLDANAGQRTSISEKTRLENHPWVKNAEEEMIKMENDMEQNMNFYPEENNDEEIEDTE